MPILTLCLALSAMSAQAGDIQPAAAAQGAAAPAAVAPADAPKIEFSESLHDFGNVEYGTPAEIKFKITNSGKSTLVINDAKASCGCTVPTLPDKELSPGESVDMTVSYDTKRKGPFDKTVTVTSNDPANGTAYVRIKGTVVSEVEVEPMRVFYGSAFRDEEAANRQKLRIHSSSFKGLQITKVESDNPALEASYQKRASGEDYNLIIALKKSAPIGNLNATVKVHTNSTKMPVVDVPVNGQVYGNIEMNPPRFYFGPKGPGEPQTAEMTLKDRKHSKTFKIKEVKDSAGMLELKVETVVEGEEYKLLASTKKMPENGNPYFNGEVTVTTTSADEPTLTIPYNGYIQQAQAPNTSPVLQQLKPGEAPKPANGK